MSAACIEFRARLESLLAGKPEAPALDRLTWHEHLSACEACRHLLAEEEALEGLLRTLPMPSLPPELARRVLLRLVRARRVEGELDALLDLAAPAPAPKGLAGRILERLSEHRSASNLDDLLERLPEPGAPAGLARRLIARLAPERGRAGLEPDRGLARLEPEHRPAQMEPQRRPAREWTASRRRTALLAASLALAFGAGAWWIASRGSANAPSGRGAPIAQPELAPQALPDSRAPGGDSDPPSEELLASLELLENWELVTADDLDVLLAASFDTLDEVLLDVELDEGEGEPAPKAPATKG